jgi:eukaryotic-like serine/threonine-protein kinase
MPARPFSVAKRAYGTGAPAPRPPCKLFELRHRPAVRTYFSSIERSEAATLRPMPARGPMLDEDVGGRVSPLQLGDIVAGKYRIERQIGFGGMGIVLAATHLQLEHLVAIKVMRRDLLEDDKLLSRLLSEARAAARIRSEHVARVLDVGTLDDGAPFIVMEYLEGEDLGDLLDRQGALAVEQAVSFMLQSCEALAEVHVAEMVHRDLKPSNLFIARLPDGSPTLKILDFGISKHIGGPAREGPATTSPQVLGSPYYMAPEQMRADPVDERSDIWALGTILFEMLTGRPPFIGDTLPEVYSAVLSSTPPAVDSLRPGIPVGLDDVVQRCLDKDPAQRFCDVADLAEALAAFGGPGSQQCVERITRILTNTDPIRGRYSAVPRAPEAAVPQAPENAVPNQAVAQRTSVPPALEVSARRSLPPAGQLGERLSSNPLAARADTAVPPRPSLHTPMDLGALSATGGLPSAGQHEQRPRRGRLASGVVVMMLAALAASRWLHRAEPAKEEPPAPSAAALPVASTPVLAEPPPPPPQPPPAVSPSVSMPKIAPLASAEPEVTSATPAPQASPKILVEKHALRPALTPRKAPPKRQPAADKLEQLDENPIPEPSAEPAPEVVPATPGAETAVPTAPVPAARGEAARAEDPWNPSSFGERH